MTRRFGAHILLLVLCIAFATKASASPDLRDFDSLPEFSYEKTAFKNPSTFIDAIEGALKTTGLGRIVSPPRTSGARLAISRVDAIFSSGDLSEAAFLILGVKPSVALPNPAVTGEGLLYHGTSDGQPFAAMIFSKSGRRQSEILESIKSLSRKSKRKSAARRRIWPELITGAKANASFYETCLSKASQLKDWVKDTAEPVASVLRDSTPAQIIFGCMTGIDGAVAGVGQGVYELLTSPIETGKKFIAGVKGAWDAINRFRNDVMGEAAKLIEGFSQMTAYEIAHLACEVITAAGIGIVTAYFTAATVGPAIIAKIAEAISKIKKVSTFSSKAAKATKAAAAREKYDELGKTIREVAENQAALPAEVALRANEETIKSLYRIPFAQRLRNRAAGLNKDELIKLFDDVSNHPVASLCKLEKYDSTRSGFCPGRAMTAHLEAIRAGLQKESIRKVWAVGKLQTPDGKSWNFHVTTVARGSNGRWFAIDPIMGRPLPIEVWYQAMQQLDSTHTMRLFSTEAKRFLPSAEKKYDKQRLQDEVFNGYYEDTLRLFREESKELLEKTSAD